MAGDNPEDDRDEEERKKRALELSDEIARKYSADRLTNIMVAGAGHGEKLDLATRMEMERRIGGSFEGVRVFRGPLAEEITHKHRADAVTIAATGMILVREGPRSDPKTALGKALLAHELTHVKQAQEGLHFALEEGHSQEAPHEKEAERAESAAYAEATGAKGGGGGGDARAVEGEIVKRVLELFSEHSRLGRERGRSG
jgi:hypothetical protein